MAESLRKGISHKDGKAVTTWLLPEEVEALRRAAAREDRTPAAQVRVVLRRFLQEQPEGSAAIESGRRADG
jgi:hypothetical protein